VYVISEPVPKAVSEVAKIVDGGFSGTTEVVVFTPTNLCASRFTPIYQGLIPFRGGSAIRRAKFLPSGEMHERTNWHL
jgi:hypothetical protein